MVAKILAAGGRPQTLTVEELDLVNSAFRAIRAGHEAERIDLNRMRHADALLNRIFRNVEKGRFAPE